ncbi:MAG: hypothetical protein WEB62_03615, partial [Bacteroidota bacterium]
MVWYEFSFVSNHLERNVERSQEERNVAVLPLLRKVRFMICATQDNYFRMAMLGLVERCRYPDFPVSVWEHHGIPNDWKGRGESEMRSVG